MLDESVAVTWTRRLLIDGALVDGRGEPLAVFDPATEEPILALPTADPEQVSLAIAAARRAFDRSTWSTDADERSRVLHSLADQLEDRFDEMTSAMVREVGTPVSTAPSLQIQVTIDALRWFAAAALHDRTEELGPALAGPPSASSVTYVPTGVVAAITAYNYPLTLAAFKLGAAAAAGCTVVLMPSAQAPLTTLMLGEMIVTAGCPRGALNVIAGEADAGRALCVDPRVDKVTFTGSPEVGSLVMQQAAVGLKGVVLELGGKSPAVVLPGADLAAVMAPLHGRYLRNAGQGCQSPTRLLVHESQVDDFIERTRATYEQMPVGNPWDPSTVVGPVISGAHRARIEGFVADAVRDGGQVVAGGGDAEFERGWYVNSTLVAGVDNQHAIARQEIFGPVAVLLSYRDTAEAIAIANDSEFGLHAMVFGDEQECFQVAYQLRAGTVSINGGGGFRPDAPLGGFRSSGVGRELGELGLREFFEPRHIQWSLAERERR